MLNRKKSLPTLWHPVILETCQYLRNNFLNLINMLMYNVLRYFQGSPYQLCREHAISAIFLHSSWELNMSCLCKRTLHLHTVREEFVFHNMLHCIPNNSLIQGVQFKCSPPKFSKGSHPTKKYVTVWILSKGPWPPPPLYFWTLSKNILKSLFHTDFFTQCLDFGHPLPYN